MAPVIEVDARDVNSRRVGAVTARIRERHLAVLRGEDPDYERLVTRLS